MDRKKACIREFHWPFSCPGLQSEKNRDQINRQQLPGISQGYRADKTKEVNKEMNRRIFFEFNE